MNSSSSSLLRTTQMKRSKPSWNMLANSRKWNSPSTRVDSVSFLLPNLLLRQLQTNRPQQQWQQCNCCKEHLFCPEPLLQVQQPLKLQQLPYLRWSVCPLANSRQSDHRRSSHHWPTRQACLLCSCLPSLCRLRKLPGLPNRFCWRANRQLRPRYRCQQHHPGQPPLVCQLNLFPCLPLS